MKNLFLTSALLLAVVLNSVVLTSCSKEDDIENIDPKDTTSQVVTPKTPVLPANEVAVDSATGTFVVNGTKISLAKFFGFSTLKSLDTTDSERFFYTMYLVNKKGNKDTTVHLYSLQMNASPVIEGISRHYVQFAFFGDSVFTRNPLDGYMNLLHWTDNHNNVSIKIENQTMIFQELSNFDVPRSYSIKVVSIDKDGNYFRGLINTKDTLTFYQREKLLVGAKLLDKTDLYKLYKKTKVVVEECLPLTNLNEFDEYSLKRSFYEI